MKNCNLIVIISVLLVVIVNITYYSKKSYFMILFLIKKIKDYFMKKNIFIALGFLLVSLVMFTGCEPNSEYWEDWEEKDCFLTITEQVDKKYGVIGVEVEPYYAETKKNTKDKTAVLYRHRYTRKPYCTYRYYKYNVLEREYTEKDKDNFYITTSPEAFDGFYIWCDENYVYIANTLINDGDFYYVKNYPVNKATYKFTFNITGLPFLDIGMK